MFCYSQNHTRNQIIHEIGILQGDDFSPLDFDLSSLNIEKKISRALRIDKQKINLINRIFLKDIFNNWYMQYEYNFDNSAGIYKEKLTKIGSRLTITESRSSEIALSTNCNKVILNDSDQHCECVNIIDSSSESILTYRVFSSLN